MSKSPEGDIVNDLEWRKTDGFQWSAWIVGRSFQSFARREGGWLLVLDENVQLAVGCLWRLIENDRVRFTSLDDGQVFGLPLPVDAAAEVTLRLSSGIVESVELRDGTLDLELRLNTGHSFQVIPDSSGYESWNLYNGNMQVVAVGGGDLAHFTLRSA